MDTKLILSAIWVVVMLIYLLGDVLRIFSGEMAKMQVETNFTQAIWFVAAVLMLIPILMIFLTLAVPLAVNRGLSPVTQRPRREAAGLVREFSSRHIFRPTPAIGTGSFSCFKAAHATVR